MEVTEFKRTIFVEVGGLGLFLTYQAKNPDLGGFHLTKGKTAHGTGMLGFNDLLDLELNMKTARKIKEAIDADLHQVSIEKQGTKTPGRLQGKLQAA